ncbi:NAD(P)-binding protein [Mycena maculata]|uniref:NAD(P)-binding protein n=1 Tax=Mycena maculata TaxID=230809 RepID=A0AAD7HLP8_9AGAR|nr:NAD(P)-binding protein [Mycena maculata]
MTAIRNLPMFEGIALVTGAAQGIGKAIALRLADDGFDVAVNDVPANSENLSEVVKEIRAKGRTSSAHLADVSVEDQVKGMVAEVHYLVISYLTFLKMVANAGVCKWARLSDTSVDEWDRVMAINGRGTFLCYKYAGMQMISQGRGGRIIGACSVAGKRVGSIFMGTYSASKFAVRGLTQAAALEFGRYSITVNSYAPGAIETQMLDYLDQNSSMSTGSGPGSFTRIMTDNTPLRRIGTTTDIAQLVSFIASKESAFITGQTIAAKNPPHDIVRQSPSADGEPALTSDEREGPCAGRHTHARGIGKAIALRLADDGFNVAINDIANQASALAEVVEEIKQKGREGSAHVADVAIEEQVRNMVEQVVDTYGRLDAMVANAGVASYTPMFEMSTQEWDRILSINARGTFLCYKYAGKQMIKQGHGGRIVGASSIAGKQGSPFNPAYTAAKFAVRGLTQVASLEFGRYSITVNAYAPGAIDTDMLSFVNPSGRSESIDDQFKQASPLGIIGVPNDVANLVAFLVSKESQFMTGQTISINGGVYFD